VNRHACRSLGFFDGLANTLFGRIKINNSAPFDAPTYGCPTPE
jgi:hypothetical protein